DRRRRWRRGGCRPRGTCTARASLSCGHGPAAIAHLRSLRIVRLAPANGIDLSFQRCGVGPRLVFLNGSGSSIATSELLIKLFTNDFDVIAHDQRGLGKSAIPPGPYTMAEYAADAVAVLDHVGWERTRVVGVSFGGMV